MHEIVTFTVGCDGLWMASHMRLSPGIISLFSTVRGATLTRLSIDRSSFMSALTVMSISPFFFVQ